MDDFVNRKCLGIRVPVVGEVMPVEGEKGERERRKRKEGRRGSRKGRFIMLWEHGIHTITRKHLS